MKEVTPSEARAKIRRYCAYQERSHQEVRDKLYSYGLHRGDVEDIIVELISEGYLNEERFARTFAGGKFRMKRWGRIKITHALEAKGVSPNCIKIGLKEIDEESYVEALAHLLREKLESLETDDVFVARHQLSTYAVRKGYEPNLVWKEIKKLLPD
jgi:regulatory protein